MSNNPFYFVQCVLNQKYLRLEFFISNLFASTTFHTKLEESYAQYDGFSPYRIITLRGIIKCDDTLIPDPNKL
jgi:hypothetical protein